MIKIMELGHIKTKLLRKGIREITKVDAINAKLVTLTILAEISVQQEDN